MFFIMWRLAFQGQSNLQPFYPPKPDDIAMICYTSGTTGTPKVIFGHKHLLLLLLFFMWSFLAPYLQLVHIMEV